MYNTSKPSPSELPSSAMLLRSTVFAVLGAGVILVTIVLPAEYGIDPIGVGRVLGLTEVGEIKTQLVAEAEADRRLETPMPSAEFGASTEPASLVEPETYRDEITVELTPGEGAEVKLVMNAGDRAEYNWTASGGILNCDQQGSAFSEPSKVSLFTFLVPISIR